MKILDCLNQEIIIGDILMITLSNKGMSRILEPVVVKSFFHDHRPNSKNTTISLLIKNREKNSLIEFNQCQTSEKNSDVKIECVIKILNPEFFLHDERVSLLLSQRPAILENKQV